MEEPAPDSISVAELVVSESDLASALPIGEQDHFPSVFATARMVALMEIASARALHPCLGEGQLSVGVSVDVTHTAPTPLGGTVTASARYVGREGKLFIFEVVADDDVGKVGRGTHKRAIVDVSRLEGGAARRRPPA
jgi:predicted thioesterase